MGLVESRKALRLAITDTLRGRTLTAEQIAYELRDVAPRNRVETEILRLVGQLVVCGIYQESKQDRAQRYELFEDVVKRLKEREKEGRGRRGARPRRRRADRIA